MEWNHGVVATLLKKHNGTEVSDPGAEWPSGVVGLSPNGSEKVRYFQFASAEGVNGFSLGYAVEARCGLVRHGKESDFAQQDRQQKI
jgi:hypothetical protein